MKDNLKTKKEIQAPAQDKILELYRVICAVKGFSEADALEAYARDLINVPDIRLASDEQIQNAINSLQNPEYKTENKQKGPISFEVI